MLYKYTGFLQGTIETPGASLQETQTHSCKRIDQTAFEFDPFYSLTCYFIGLCSGVDKV